MDEVRFVLLTVGVQRLVEIEVLGGRKLAGLDRLVDVLVGRHHQRLAELLLIFKLQRMLTGSGDGVGESIESLLGHRTAKASRTQLLQLVLEVVHIGRVVQRVLHVLQQLLLLVQFVDRGHLLAADAALTGHEAGGEAIVGCSKSGIACY